ncbi:hypothetical protein JXA48_04730 [Candidatus Woesearchaeota archaeon]|nr:hypothetical protein [Candidatus Woesearchaeota archaeon]
MESKLVFESEIISLIQDKQELKSLDKSYIKKILLSNLSDSMIKKLNSYSSFKQCKRGKVCGELISLTRKILRDRYGVFIRTPLSNYKKKLLSLSSFDDDYVDSILSFHQSTFERLPYYSSFYPLLFKELFSLGLSEKFSLGDFACGYNPLAYKYLPVKPTNYFACDISSDEMSLINSFFVNQKISAEARSFDLLSDDFSNFISNQKFDVVFLLKALDSLEIVKKHSSKKLLDAINTHFFVVSFPLVSIGGKNSIDSTKRSWFEKFCEKQSWSYSTLSVPNELFYVVKKE